MEGILSALTVPENNFGNYVIFAGTFLGILLFVSGIMQLLAQGENHGEAHSRRMRMIAEGKKTQEILALLKPQAQEKAFLGLPFLGTLPRDIQQAGMIVTPNRYVTFCALTTAAVFLVASGFLPLLQSAILAPVVGLVIPILAVRRKKAKRLQKLTSQLPDALDLMSRGLAVGHPLNTSIGAVSEEMSDPIGTEFGIIFDQVSFGDDLTDAMQDFAERVDTEDAHYLSASIGIQYGTGGDLARVTRLLADTVRGRIAMRRKIHAISSEGRMTAQFLSGLPIGIFLVTSYTEPNYYGGIIDDPLFPYFAGFVLMLTAANYIVLRRLVNFRI